MTTCIYDKGVVEEMKKSNPPPVPPPAGDMTDLIQIELPLSF